MSSPLRSALRSRLTTAMRDRDRHAVGVLRSAVAAIENAEAVAVDDGPTVTSSATSSATSSVAVAGAPVGLGVTEAERRPLDDASERSLVLAEVQALLEAETDYAAAGESERARSAAAGASLLTAVLDEVRGDVG